MQKIGFFGGCFNPPTNTHLNLAINLINQKKLDKVVFVPVGDYYNKNNLISAKHRYNMLKIATANYNNIKVEDIVINSKDKLYAVDTFKLISDKYSKECDIYFIMGSDNFEKMPNWKNYEDIKDKYKFIVIERREEISSTDIRDKIKRGEQVSEYIDSNVLKYIEENKLYNQDIF